MIFSCKWRGSEGRNGRVSGTGAASKLDSCSYRAWSNQPDVVGTSSLCSTRLTIGKCAMA